jgi:hypothetical protein
MGNLEMTILLIGVIGGFAWIVVRVVGGLAAGGESSARADTFAGGRGIAAEHADDIRRTSEHRGHRDA